jgi:hypothetical protein
MKTNKLFTSLALGLLLVGCSQNPTVADVEEAFNKLSEEEKVELLEGSVGDFISEQLEKAFEEGLQELEDDIVFEEEGLGDEVLNELVQNIGWTFVKDEFGNVTATGVLENTTNQEIDYIEIEYKFKKDGITVDSSFTNANNIAPSEKVKIEIWTYEEFDTLEVEGSDGWE